MCKIRLNVKYVINGFLARDIWVLERKNRVSIDSRMK